MIHNSLYPTSPSNIDKKTFLKENKSFKRKVYIAAFSVFLFFFFYFGTIFLLGYWIFLAFTTNVGNLVYLCSPALVLILFLLKFFYKSQKEQKLERIFIDKKSHEKFFSFIEKICEEVETPIPNKIYVDFNVNASVSYSNHWKSLIMPVEKELTIGLPLIDSLTISELKAILGHEFGHFSQRSMKITSYVSTANLIIQDLIYNRDAFEEFMNRIRKNDIVLETVALIHDGLLWGTRKLLGFYYLFLNVNFSKLRHEMEFNADKFAVSISGSEPIISALWKLNKTDELYSKVLQELYFANKHKFILNNLFDYFSPKREELIRELELSKLNFKDDPRGGKVYFEPGNSSTIPLMYSSHPSNKLREDNAKTPYIISEIDTRSAWVLFDDKIDLQVKITNEVNSRLKLQDNEYKVIDADFLNEFIQVEKRVENSLKIMNNTYINRFFYVPENFEELQLIEESKLNLFYDALIREEINLMKPIHEIDAIISKLEAYFYFGEKVKTIVYNNIVHKQKDFPTLYTGISNTRNRLIIESFIPWDSKVCQYFLTLALRQSCTMDLLNLYQQHFYINHLSFVILNVKNKIINEHNHLHETNSIAREELVMARLIDNLFNDLNKILNEEHDFKFIPLANISSMEALKKMIKQDLKFVRPEGNIYEFPRFENLMETLHEANNNMEIIERKSISEVMIFHNKLLQNNH